MATTRKAIGKKTRFEVFKRDSFKCQYCGAAAPETVLQIDHINPVSAGGDNSITNLITSCQGCNSGKSNVKLDDNTAISKEKRQLDELNEQRNQLEMMMEWRRGLLKIGDREAQHAGTTFHTLTGEKMTRSMTRDMRGWIKKYGLQQVIDAIEIASEKYDPDRAFSKIGGILYVTEKAKTDPDIEIVCRVKGKMRYAGMHVTDKVADELIRAALQTGKFNLESLKNFVGEVRNWTEWRSGMERAIAEHGGAST